MAVATWDDSFSTHHPVVDAQHQDLFRMVNDLHDAIMAGRSKEILTPTLEKLARYTVEHFRSEEALMAEVNYPAQMGHKRKHDDLTKEVKSLMDSYATGKTVLTITLSNFLANWLRHHIKQDDMALVRYVNEHRSR